MNNKHTLGWIGMGRMGYPMAEKLVDAGNNVSLWNRTRAKAEPLAEKGANLVDNPSDLSSVDILFTMVSTGADLNQVLFGDNGVLSGNGSSSPKIIVDCSSIGGDESVVFREKFAERGAEYISAPVSGNGKCVKAGKLSVVASGPEAAFNQAKPYLETFALRGVSYVGEGELARFCKIAHNVMLGVVIQNLAEITILAQKAGVPRHAFLDFMNNSVMGSIFTRYKSNALVNLDWTTTFTPPLLRKDLDLGLKSGRELDVPMPVTAATREALQAHFGAAQLKDDPDAYLQADFSAILETVALAAGVSLKPEDVPIPTGLEVPEKK
ncbi:MAG: NAD(P)-dependent oxidoreductase [Methyloligellaceae bacterium]